MIKRILNPEEFCKVIDDLDDAFAFENKHQGHFLLEHDKESIKASFANKYLLNWDVFVWANEESGKYDALIIFINEKSIKFNKGIFSEFLWISKNPKVGFKLLREAIKFAKEKGFEYVAVSTAVRNPKSEKVKRIYEKFGFLKDTETYIAKL